MSVLVAYATRHGATRGIAQRISEVLESRGLEVSVDDVDHIRDIAGHDAFVIGSAAYMGRWLPRAAKFARRHRSTLASKPVWLSAAGQLAPIRSCRAGRLCRGARSASPENATGCCP